MPYHRGNVVLVPFPFSDLSATSALKTVLFTLAPSRVEYHIGALTSRDLAEVDRRLRLALALD
jgi:hypothetical protein